MRASNVLGLNDWIVDNKTRIQFNKQSQKSLAEEAAESLGYKVSTNALRDVLVANGIETRPKTKHQREVEALRQEVDMLRQTLIKVVTASNVPEWLRKELLTEDLTEEIKECLRRKTG